MFRISAIAFALWRRFEAAFRGEVPTAETAPMDAARLTSALYNREAAGLVTQLRDVHGIAGMNQPNALRLVALLERADMVIIERDLHDAFASTVTLSNELRTELMHVSRRDAA